jgi:hypothetical protein
MVFEECLIDISVALHTPGVACDQLAIGTSTMSSTDAVIKWPNHLANLQ